MRHFYAFFLVLITTVCYSQAGATIFAGLTSGKSKDATLTKDNELHLGYTLGLDARLNSGSLYFMLNAEYVKIDVKSRNDLDFFAKEHRMSMIKGRAGMGFDIIHINRDVFLSSKILASINMVIDSDTNAIQNSEYIINDGFLGAATGLSLTLKSFVIELEYELGILNMYFEKPNTTFNYLTLKLGFKF